MSVSQKYRTFDQLLEDVTVDFRTYALEGMIEPQQLIKVAIKVNYDLGLRIQRTRHAVIEVENSKAQLPTDFNVLNFAAVCGTYLINSTVPSGTHIVHVKILDVLMYVLYKVVQINHLWLYKR